MSERGRDGLLADVGAGAAVTFVLSFLPCSSVLGGAVTAFRRESGYLGGFGLGVAAGAAAAVPLLALFVPALFVAGWLGFGVAPSSPAYGVFVALVFAFFCLYTVGLGGVGGLVGVWARDNTTWDLDPARWLT